MNKILGSVWFTLMSGEYIGIVLTDKGYKKRLI